MKRQRGQRGSQKKQMFTCILISSIFLTSGLLGYSLRPEEEPVPDLRQIQTSGETNYISGDLHKDMSHLGDDMFRYAALYGVGRQNMLQVLISKNDFINYVFELNTAKRSPTDRPGQSFAKFSERFPYRYGPNSELLSHRYNVELRGYFQSWKYFIDYESELRNEFKLKPDIEELGKAYLENAKKLAKRRWKHKSLLTFVGIYIGTLANSTKIENPAITDIKQFLRVSINYFKTRYSTSAVFVVRTSNIQWFRDTIGIRDVIFIDRAAEKTTLSVLSQCNHTIFTHGTLGWWAGWLAGGEVVYYSQNSSDTKDTFMPTWKAMH